MFSKVLPKIAGGMIAGAVMVLGASHANAVTYSFAQITSNGVVDVTAQLILEVTDGGTCVAPDPTCTVGNQLVNFQFSNTGATASFISEIYFDDGTLLGIASITNGTGVNYVENSTSTVSPPNLPSGNTVDPNFVATAAFSSQPVSGGSGNDGIDTGETLGILFELVGGQTFANLITAINAGVGLAAGESADGTLRIGLHVQGIVQGTSPETNVSESFINGGCSSPVGCNSQTVVPLPAALPLFLSGLGGMGLLGWRRRRKAAA